MKTIGVAKTKRLDTKIQGDELPLQRTGYKRPKTKKLPLNQETTSLHLLNISRHPDVSNPIWKKIAKLSFFVNIGIKTV